MVEMILLLFLTILVSCVHGSDILVICPTASYSHQQPFIIITEALLERNHSVTIITANPEKVKSHGNLTIVDISFTYDYWRSQKEFNLQSRKSAWENAITFTTTFTSEITPVIWKHPNVQDFLRKILRTKKTYDAILLEYWCCQSFWGFVDLVGRPPVIGLSTVQTYSPLTIPFNNPENPSFIPMPWSSYTNQMNFRQRFYNTILYLVSCYFFIYKTFAAEQEVLYKYVGEQNFNRTLKEIFLDGSRNSLMTSADSRITGFVKPVFPNIIDVGPLHLVKPKKLSPDLQEWLDGAEKGVIYFSLGSNMQGSSMGDFRRRAFLRAFEKRSGYRVLWKWETEDRMEGQSENVLLRKWISQQSVFAHPNVKLFITQGGLQSMQEAFHYGIKMICIPMFGDQDMNCQRIAKIKTGVILEFEDLNEKIISEALKTVLEDPVYEQNMKYYSYLSKDNPMKPIEKSVWWIEYVLRHKGVAHMASHAAKMPYYQYYLLDVIGCMLAIIAAILLIVYLTLRKIIKKIGMQKINVKQINKKFN